MFKFLNWVSAMVWKKPRTFIMVLLVLGLLVLSRVVIYQNNKLESFETQREKAEGHCNRRIDSLAYAYSLREDKLNEETKATLKSVIEDYRRQLQEQKELNQKISLSIQENDKALRNNIQKLKQLRDE